MFEEFIKTAFKQAAAILPSKSVKIRGVFIKATPTDSQHYSKGVLGGYEPNERQGLTVATADLPTTAKELDNEFIEVDGVEWQIEKVSLGNVITTLDLKSPDEG